ncbi:MAG: flagellar basal body rod protein FlgB [Pseudomonadota bacterium]|nr:flagellar basal body rod protein FlgB [Pseudomonadota bacterium]
MTLHDVPLFTLLKGRLGHLTQRQRLISQNVANADTPGYVGRDLGRFTFSDALKAQRGPDGMARTNAAHLAGPKRADAVWKSHSAPDSSTTLDGNAVVLEEQMMKMAESRADYEAAVGFYQKSLGLMRLAAKRPGG